MLRHSASGLTYDVVPSQSDPTRTEWRVEAIDFSDEGKCYAAIFFGPLAKERAEEYAALKNARAGS